MSVRSSHQRGSIKKVVLKNLPILTGKHLCQGLPFKSKSNTGVSCGQLFFGSFNGSLLDRSQGSRSRLHNCIRLQGPSHRSSFQLQVNSLSTYFLKPKTNTVDESVKFLHRLFLVVLDVFRSIQMVLGRFVVLDCFGSFYIVLGHFRSLWIVFSCFRLFQFVPLFNRYLNNSSVYLSFTKCYYRYQSLSCNNRNMWSRIRYVFIAFSHSETGLEANES